MIKKANEVLFDKNLIDFLINTEESCASIKTQIKRDKYLILDWSEVTIEDVRELLSRLTPVDLKRFADYFMRNIININNQKVLKHYFEFFDKHYYSREYLSWLISETNIFKKRAFVYINESDIFDICIKAYQTQYVEHTLNYQLKSKVN